MWQRIRQQSTHRAFVLAVAIATLSTTTAYADDWCGYTTRDNAIIECGYTTMADCQSAVDKDGKGGTCFMDPDTALNMKRATPANATRLLEELEQKPRRS